MLINCDFNITSLENKSNKDNTDDLTIFDREYIYANFDKKNNTLLLPKSEK